MMKKTLFAAVVSLLHVAGSAWSATSNIEFSIGGDSAEFPVLSKGFLVVDTAGDGFDFEESASLLLDKSASEAGARWGDDDVVLLAGLETVAFPGVGRGFNSAPVEIDSAVFSPGSKVALVWFPKGESTEGSPYSYYTADQIYDDRSTTAFKVPEEGATDSIVALNAFPTVKSVVSSNGGSVPKITSSGNARGTVGEAFNYKITASNTPTAYGAEGLPEGLSVNSNTGEITGNPTLAGQSVVSVVATNKQGSRSSVLVIEIAEAPLEPPQINSATTASATLGKPFKYSITGTNTPESFTATGLPQGLRFDASTGVISGRPFQSGIFAVTVTATNEGGTGSATFALTISEVPASSSNDSGSSDSGSSDSGSSDSGSNDSGSNDSGSNDSGSNDSGSSDSGSSDSGSNDSGSSDSGSSDSGSSDSISEGTRNANASQNALLNQVQQTARSLRTVGGGGSVSGNGGGASQSSVSSKSRGASSKKSGGSSKKSSAKKAKGNAKKANKSDKKSSAKKAGGGKKSSDSSKSGKSKKSRSKKK